MLNKAAPYLFGSEPQDVTVTGGGGGGTANITVGPDFGRAPSNVIVTTRLTSVNPTFTNVPVFARLAASYGATLVYTISQPTVGLYGGFSRAYTVGGSAVAEEATVGDGWTNDANLTGLRDTNLAHMDGSGVGDLNACEGRLVLDYANIDADRDDAEVIDTVTLRFYIRSTGTLLANGDLRPQWRRISTDAFTTLETITGDVDNLAEGGSRNYDITTSIRDWADIDTLQSAVFGDIDVAEPLLDYDADAVELVITSHRVTITDDPRSLTNCMLWLDADNLNTTRQDTAGATAARTNSDPVRLWKDVSGNGNDVTRSTGDIDNGTLVLSALGSRPGIAVGCLTRAITPVTTTLTLITACRGMNGAADVFRGHTSNTTTRAFRGLSCTSFPTPRLVFKYVDDAGTAKTIDPGTTDGFDNEVIVSVRVGSGGLVWRINGIQVGSDVLYTQALLDEYRMGLDGGGNPLARLFDVRLFHTDLTDAQIRRQERSLGAKYGMSIP